jgi:deoxyribodipyrimidine photolyase
MSAAPFLLWFRRDPRLSGNPAPAAALERRTPAIPVFVWAPAAIALDREVSLSEHARGTCSNSSASERSSGRLSGPVNRERPGMVGTSRPSPHLHFGYVRRWVDPSRLRKK